MYWAPLAIGVSTLALVSGSQERAIGDVLAGAPGTFHASLLFPLMIM
jgi:hypothetical protein